jgi:hypothetical protein
LGVFKCLLRIPPSRYLLVPCAFFAVARGVLALASDECGIDSESGDVGGFQRTMMIAIFVVYTPFYVVAVAASAARRCSNTSMSTLKQWLSRTCNDTSLGLFYASLGWFDGPEVDLNWPFPYPILPSLGSLTSAGSGGTLGVCHLG